MDHLIRPFLFVFAFWWLLLFFLFSDVKDIRAALDYLTGGALVFLIGGTFGIVFSYLARTRVVNEDVLRRLIKTEVSPKVGAFSTIGALPGFGHLPSMAKIPADESWVPQDLRKWWRWYKQTYPDYAQALAQAWAVMSAADLPAASVPGGHGQASLVEHSWNVLRTLLRIKELPPYRGMTNKDGKITFPLLDTTKTEYRFSRQDPLPMLCAFAHDIGKVVCFVKDHDGRISVVKDDHDTEGKNLVRRFSAWRMLEFNEYQRALICLGYYHKPSEVPRATWIDDRARAVLMLIHHIDEWTSELEGKGFYDDYICHPLGESAVVVDEATQEPESVVVSQDNIPNLVLSPVTTSALDESSQLVPGPLAHISDAKIIDATASILLRSGALMGTISVSGVGFKYGSWVYLHVPRLNSAMKRGLEESSDPLFDPSYCIQHTQEQPTEFIKRLMLALSNQGALKQEHENKYYGPDSAFFFLKKISRDGEVIEEQGPRPYFIVARAYAFGRSVFRLPDVRREPIIDRAVQENDYLTDENSIARVRALMQSWTEPQSEVARKEEKKREETQKTLEELSAKGIGLMPFDLSALSFMDPADIERACVRSADGETIYRVSVLAGRFAPPQVPYEIVDYNGEPCWRLLRNTNNSKRKR